MDSSEQHVPVQEGSALLQEDNALSADGARKEIDSTPLLLRRNNQKQTRQETDQVRNLLLILRCLCWGWEIDA